MDFIWGLNMWSINYRLAIIVAGSVLIANLSGCGTVTDAVGAASRVDPHTVAAYHHDVNYKDEDAYDMEKCDPIRSTGDNNPGALNLDCFHFPEDQNLQTSADGKTAYKKAVSDRRDGYYRNRLASILIGVYPLHTRCNEACRLIA
jgi:hypothetical protein